MGLAVVMVLAFALAAICMATLACLVLAESGSLALLYEERLGMAPVDEEWRQAIAA